MLIYYFKKRITNFKIPAVYIGEFTVKQNLSTFLKMDKFTKGVAIIGNDVKSTNLGRYWPNKGPQVYIFSCFVSMKVKRDFKLILFLSRPEVPNLFGCSFHYNHLKKCLSHCIVFKANTANSNCKPSICDLCPSF